MKKYFLIILLMISATIGFAQSGKDFTGIWQPADNKILPKGFLLFIDAEHGKYSLSNSKTKKPVIFDYSKSDNTLIGKIEGSYVIIRYLPKDGHILMMPQTRADPIEFKKTSFSK